MDFFVSGFLFIFFVFILSSILCVLGLLLGKKMKLSREKLSSFECGFDPLESSRSTFSLRFFLLAVVFLIFDVELVLFLPYILSITNSLTFFMKLGMGIFVLILLVGLIHELNEGSLDWSY